MTRACAAAKGADIAASQRVAWTFGRHEFCPLPEEKEGMASVSPSPSDQAAARSTSTSISTAPGSLVGAVGGRPRGSFVPSRPLAPCRPCRRRPARCRRMAETPSISVPNSRLWTVLPPLRDGRERWCLERPGLLVPIGVGGHIARHLGDDGGQHLAVANAFEESIVSLPIARHIDADFLSRHFHGGASRRHRLAGSRRRRRPSRRRRADRADAGRRIPGHSHHHCRR